MSVRWRHCIDHADTKQKPLMRPDCLLGVVPQSTDSRLSETTAQPDLAVTHPAQTKQEDNGSAVCCLRCDIFSATR